MNSRGLLILVALTYFVAGPIAVRAQESVAPAPVTDSQETAPATDSQETAQPAVKSPWSFGLTSYVWFAGLSGDVGVGGLPPVEVDASFSDIFDHIDWWPPPIMLAGEVRYDRFAFLTDFIRLGLQADGASSGPLPVTADVDMSTIIWTFAGSYRAFQNDTVTLDLLSGGRLWNLNADMTLTGPLGGRQASGSITLVDPIIGIAGKVNLGSGFALRAEGDVGGFGAAADLDWQAFGALQYEVNDLMALQAGYRYLAVDYRDDGFVFDAAMSGPIIGATFRF